MKILTESELFSPGHLAKIEKYYQAKYVCETCIGDSKGNWINQPIAIFYQADKAKVPKGGSQWFGIYYSVDFIEELMPPNTLSIMNAISATEHDISGIMAENGDVIYSHYRHDYRTSPDGTVWIDGGRDYIRYNPVHHEKLVNLRIIRNKLCVVGK